MIIREIWTASTIVHFTTWLMSYDINSHSIEHDYYAIQAETDVARNIRQVFPLQWLLNHSRM